MQIIAAASKMIVLLVAFLITVVSIWGVVVPARMLRLVRRVFERPGGLQILVLVRLMFGLALLFAAPGSRYPVVFYSLGWLALAAAMGLAIMGGDRARGFVGWFEGMPARAVRLWLLIAIVFGPFLVYGLV